MKSYRNATIFHGPGILHWEFPVLRKGPKLLKQGEDRAVGDIQQRCLGPLLCSPTLK